MTKTHYRWVKHALVACAWLLLGSKCVDERQEGIVGELLIQSAESDVEPGQDFEIAVQVLDDAGEPLSGADVEIQTTDLSRLVFDGTSGDRTVVTTEDSLSFQGTALPGSVLVGLHVPDTAPEGTALFIASSEGDRTAKPTTRWVELTITAGGGVGGAAGAAGAATDGEDQ